MSHDQAKESGLHLLPLLGVPQKHQANSYNILAEHLAQIHAGSMIAIYVSVRVLEIQAVLGMGSLSCQVPHVKPDTASKVILKRKKKKKDAKCKVMDSSSVISVLHCSSHLCLTDLEPE